MALTLSHFLVLPHIVATSDLIAPVAERVARAAIGAGVDIAIHESPVAGQSRILSLIWGRGTDPDPACAWLRGLISEVCADL